MYASGDTCPLTWRQLRGVYVVVGLAVSLLLNRSALPTWMLAEYWGSAPAAEAAVVDAATRFHSRGRIDLASRPTLFVGDSLTRACPTALGDVISLNGATAATLNDFFREAVAEAHYETIVLWPGTSHIRRQGSIEEYVAGAVDMVRTAREHADRVLIVTPMPYHRVPGVSYIEYVHRALPSRVAWASYRLKRALAEAGLEDIGVFDAGAFRSRAILTGNFGAWFDDTTHPNTAGFKLLWTSAAESLPAASPRIQLARP